MNLLVKTVRLTRRKVIAFLFRLKHVSNTTLWGGFPRMLFSDLRTGEYVFIGARAIIYPRVKLGNYTMLANDVMILGKDHSYRKAGVPIIFQDREELPETIIGKDCWIGAGVIIHLGVTIGDGTIVAAGSVVTKDCEPFSIYGGVPARKIQERFQSPEEILLHKKMLELEPEKVSLGNSHVSKLTVPKGND